MNRSRRSINIEGFLHFCKISILFLYYRYHLIPKKILVILVLLCPPVILILLCGMVGSWHRRPEVRLKKFLLSSGIIFIKLGQVLSVRPDLIGEKYAKALLDLTDNLKPDKSFAMVEMVQKVREMGLVSEIEELPVASASIAQVYKGKMGESKNIAIKIVKPLVRNRIESDIKMLYFIARMHDRIFRKSRINAMEVVRMLSEYLMSEVDMRIEAKNITKMRENHLSDMMLFIPKVHYVDESILIISWCDDIISLYDIESIERLGYNRKVLAEEFVGVVLRQIYRYGFFHADLHPGNIFVDSKSRLVMLDFGTIGKIDERERFFVIGVLSSFIAKDYHKMAELHKEFGYLESSVNLVEFSAKTKILGDKLLGKMVSEISVADILYDLLNLAKEFGMRPQPRLMMLHKTTLLIEGISRNLNPQINMWEIADQTLKAWL